MSRDTCMIEDNNAPACPIALPHQSARQTFYALYNLYTAQGWSDDNEGLVIDLSGEDSEAAPDAPVYIDSVILRHQALDKFMRLVLTEYAV